MRIALRWAGYLVAGLIILIIIVAAAIWVISARQLSAGLEAKAERLPMQQANLADGQRLILTRACAECHGPDLRGEEFLNDPKIAILYAPNLTQVAKTATDQQLAQAIRQGIGHDGRPLLVMPSESYASFTDAETAALIKAIRAMPVGGKATPPARLGPLGRVGMATGKLKAAPKLVAEYAEERPADLGAEYAAGRHIAMTVCSGCHGPTLSGKEAKPGTMAPNLTVTGAYDLAALTRLMRTGVPPSGRRLEMMTGVSRDAFTHFNDEEIAQLHAYLVERARRAP